jgi:uncharacterized protein YbaP (TraB family)
VRALLVAVAVAAATGCGGAAAKCELARPAATGVPFLWKATRSGASTVWLFGTVHNAPRSAVPAAAWDALAASTRFASELGDLEPDVDKLRAVSELPRGQSLATLLGDDDWYELRDALRGTVPDDRLIRMRPWYAMSRLTATLAPSARPGMDDALTQEAKAKHLAVEHFETWDQQLGSLVDAVNVEDLRVALRARKTMKCDAARVVALYESGDEAAIAPVLSGRDPEKLLWARNRAWVPQIEEYAATGGAFVAVGIGHLVGEHGVPALLAARGYTVERVGVTAPP